MHYRWLLYQLLQYSVSSEWITCMWHAQSSVQVHYTCATVTLHTYYSFAIRCCISRITFIMQHSVLQRQLRSASVQHCAKRFIMLTIYNRCVWHTLIQVAVTVVHRDTNIVVRIGKHCTTTAGVFHMLSLSIRVEHISCVLWPYYWQPSATAPDTTLLWLRLPTTVVLHHKQHHTC